MSWNVTMLFIHIIAVVCVFQLYQNAPCLLQKLAMGIFMVSLLIFCFRFFWLLGVGESPWLLIVKRVALALEHIGVLVYVFRLAYKEKIECKSSRQASSL